MNPGGSGFAGTLTTLRWSLVPGLPDFSADGLRRGGHPRFGSGPDPLSSVGTLAPGQRPAPDENEENEKMALPSVVLLRFDAREERSMLECSTRSCFYPWPCAREPVHASVGKVLRVSSF